VPDGQQLVDVSVLSPSFGWAAGAIVSTADDVARFFRALLQGRLLRPGLLRAMQSTVKADELSAGARYGLGLAWVRLPCGPAWGHAGGTPGYGTWAVNSKDGHRQIVVLVNSDELPARAERARDRVVATAYCDKEGS
jgi:D-alanyl-D-alanine carboxypeptidase